MDMSQFILGIKKALRNYELDRQPLSGSIGDTRLRCLKSIVNSDAANAQEDIAKLAVFIFFYADPHRMSGSALLLAIREELMRAMDVKHVLLDPLNLALPPATFECYGDRTLKECFNAYSAEAKQAARDLCLRVLQSQGTPQNQSYATSRVILWFLNLMYNVFKVDFLKGQGLTLSAQKKSDLDAYIKANQREHCIDHSAILRSLSLFRGVPEQGRAAESLEAGLAP